MCHRSWYITSDCACMCVQVLLRIRADDASALCCLGSKYGADPGPTTTAALAAGAALGVNVVGVSFHVGSASRNPQVRILYTLSRTLCKMETLW